MMQVSVYFLENFLLTGESAQENNLSVHSRGTDYVVLTGGNLYSCESERGRSAALMWKGSPEHTNKYKKSSPLQMGASKTYMLTYTLKIADTHETFDTGSSIWYAGSYQSKKTICSQYVTFECFTMHSTPTSVVSLSPVSVTQGQLWSKNIK